MKKYARNVIACSILALVPPAFSQGTQPKDAEPAVRAAQAMQGKVQVEGNPAMLAELFSLLDSFAPMFEIIEPKKPAS
jgi:Alkyl sulfatase C-terminal